MEYATFYDYIKNELCVNKDIVEMECNGKCYLMKELAKAANSDNDTKKNHSFSIELSVVYFENTTNYVFGLIPEQHSKIESSYQKIYKFQYMGFVFHPPISITS
ncbi:hypothetical protein MC378_10135 [Polaribacter sp. MSW13]|uniref:Uncharacterized protein n=1 Tax=Polaribacter marinus TaxID=2916838 RepID=A0A9X1VRM9_9FLAO|nr:hypothetical protein [Polaribacter marinus]